MRIHQYLIIYKMDKIFKSTGKIQIRILDLKQARMWEHSHKIHQIIVLQIEEIE